MESSISGVQYSVQYTDTKKTNENQNKWLFFFKCHLWWKEDFIHRNWLALLLRKIIPWSCWSFPIALPAQIRTPTFGTSLFSPSINLVQGTGAHTVCNTAFSLLLELHGLQPKSAESCYCHLALRLALISSTSGEKEEAMWNVGTPKSSCQEDFPLPLPHQQGFSSWRTITKLLPLHDPYSLKDPTHTNVYEESVRHLAGQAILLHREQSCRGPPLTACVLPIH